MNKNDCFALVIDSVSTMEQVQSIGKSGGKDLPEQGESDIDLYIFCTEIPSASKRQSAIDSVGSDVRSSNISEQEGQFWGTCDFATIGNMDFCLMYFTTVKMSAYIETVLSGERLDREGNYFYPTGRISTILSMYVLLDKNNYIALLKQRLAEYPALLSERLIEHHIRRLHGLVTEDMERAVSRKEVLLYHYALEIGIDHFLQALFALNKCFFPSRKRTVQYIDKFSIKPIDCANRLLEVVALGGSPETLFQSSEIWSALCGELSDLAATGEAR